MQQDNINYAKLVAASPPTWVFKQDRRSRVWQIDGPPSPTGRPADPLVVKQFLHSPLEQMVAAWLGRHPGQREVKANAELREKGIPVVPILAHGKRGLIGCRYWIVTPYVGKSVHQMGREGDLEDPRRRKHVVDSIAALTSELIVRAYWNRDHKASNMLMDPRGRLWLIDVGAVRPAKNRQHTLRMLAMLLKTLAAEEIPPAERLYLLDVIRSRCEFLGPLDQLAKDVDAVKLPR